MEEKSLSELLKEKGLDVAEDAAKLVVEAVFEFAEEAVLKTENKYDDVLVALLPVAKPLVLELVDKIDGKVGE